jgi:hypothetical protein
MIGIFVEGISFAGWDIEIEIWIWICIGGYWLACLQR